MKSAFPGARAPLFLALSFALPLASAAPAPADAPDPRHRTPAELDEVVVLASPLRQTAEQLNQPAEVLVGEKLDEARAATLGETVGRLPGVQSSNFGAGVGRPVIRGLDGARVSTLSGGLATQDVSTVSQDHSVTIEPFLADQIEVLKGPSTLLFGSGAIGGVVNVEDGRIAELAPDDALSGRAELRSDSVSDGSIAMARVDASGRDGGFVLHADGVLRNLRDYETPDGVQRNSFVDTRTGGVGASWLGADGFLGVSVSDYDNQYGNPGEPGDADVGEAGVSLDLSQRRYELKGGLQRGFGPFDGLRASVARTDYEHTEFEGDEVGTVFVNDATEARVELTHAALGDWIGAIGLQGSTRRAEAIGEEAFVPRTRTRAAGVFLVEQVQWDAVQFDLGARVDSVRTEPDALARRSFTPLSLSAGAAWAIDDRWRLSFNLDRAERAPAEEELFADGPHVATAAYEIGDPTLDEERATQGELGLHFHGARFEAKAALYQTRFDRFVYLRDTREFAPGEGDEEGLPIRAWTQADARFRGWELEGIAHLVDGDAGRLDARVFADRVRATLDHGGGNLPRIVPARVGAELRWSGEAWRASLGATRYARQDDVADGETATDGYTLVDASVAWHVDVGELGWEVFAEARNLGDEVARVHTSFLKDDVMLPGRNLGLGVRVFF
jgi:iron complex outermembrane receptor protein